MTIIESKQSEQAVPAEPEIQSMPDSREKSIAGLGLSSRVYNHLLDVEITTVDNLLQLNSLDVFVMRRGFGVTSRLEIIQKMRQNGYCEWSDRMEERIRK